MSLSILLGAVLISAAAGESAPPDRTVMTYNVFVDSKEPSRTIELVATVSPDVICIQELTQPFASSFIKRLGQTYPHRNFKPASGTWGIGIASKFPIVAADGFAQSPSKMPAALATVRFPERELVVACLHLFPPAARRNGSESIPEVLRENAILRAQQARSLVKRFATEKRAILLLGDLNAQSFDPALIALKEAGFADACDAAGADCGATWPGATTLISATANFCWTVLGCCATGLLLTGVWKLARPPAARSAP